MRKIHHKEVEYIKNIIDLNDKDFSKMIIAYSKTEGEFRKNKKLKKTNGELALKNAAKHLGINLKETTYEIINQKGGKIKNKKGEIIASASISHSDNFSFAAIGPKEDLIGLDVENSNSIIEEDLFNYIKSNFEIKVNEKTENLLQIWNKIEAVIKCVGHGLQDAKKIKFMKNNLCEFKSFIFLVKNYEIQMASEKFSIAIAKKISK